ncbi:glycosyltransferase family 87 protein, partial [Acidobacteriota bacterium]
MSIKKTILVCLILVLVSSLFLFKVKDEMRDFEVNYTAGKRLGWGETLYRGTDEHYMFKYLPSSSLIYYPLSRLPLNTAKAVWYIFVVTSCFLLFLVSGKLLGLSFKEDKYILLITALILGKFLFREIQLGQINAIVTMILLLMCRSLGNAKEDNPCQKDTVSGLLWGLATALKPYAVIFLPYFIVKRKWRALLSGLGVIGTGLLMPSLFYGIKGNFLVLKEWALTLSQSTPGLYTSQDNVSFIALFSKWTGREGLSMGLAAALIALLAVFFLWLIWRGKGLESPQILETAVLLILIPLVSPLGWDYTLLSSVLGIIIILKEFSRFPNYWKFSLVASFILIGIS